MADPEYFTLAELRAEPDMADTSKYPEALCLRAAAYITAIIEREVGTSFIPRTRTETFPYGSGSLVLASPYIQSLTSITVGGVAQTGYTAGNGVLLDAYGNVLTWPYGATVVYQAGYSTTPPADIKEAAIQGTRARLLTTHSNSGAPDRATSLSNGDGTFTLTFAGPDHPTGYPEVDAVIIGWRDKLGALGFA